MNVFVGSTRPAKVEGAREAVAAIARIDARFIPAKIIPQDLTPVAPRMPMSVAEILRGARIRASALTALPQFCIERDLAIGVEGGLEHVGAGDLRGWTLQTWAAVTDGAKWSFGAGPILLLPEYIAARVVTGEELGDVIDGLAGTSVRGYRGAWGLLTRDLIGRQDAFRLAIIAAFAPFYNGAAWDA